MITCDTISRMRQQMAGERSAGESRRVGLVPTMGALHDGHLSLIRRAREDCDCVVVSVFVNPTQFGPGEDYADYPRVLEQDQALCRAEGVDVLFAPDAGEMYAEDACTRVRVGGLSEGLCGRRRPGHFDGVVLVVCKLFQIVQPHAAYFGRKDAQQLAVIRRMVRDLNIPVDIVDCPTVREPDGLALSSRNAYLGRDERSRAAALFAALQHLREAVVAGQHDPQALCRAARQELQEAGIPEVEYVELVDPESLEPQAVLRPPVLAAVAARIGPCRLIDNLLIEDL